MHPLICRYPGIICWIMLTNVCDVLWDVISNLIPQGGLGPHIFCFNIINETNIDIYSDII